MSSLVPDAGEQVANNTWFTTRGKGTKCLSVVLRYEVVWQATEGMEFCTICINRCGRIASYAYGKSPWFLQSRLTTLPQGHTKILELLPLSNTFHWLAILFFSLFKIELVLQYARFFVGQLSVRLRWQIRSLEALRTPKLSQLALTPTCRCLHIN